MRTTLIKILWLIPVALLVISCSLIEKLDDVDFDITLPVTFTVSETASSPSGKSYSDSKTLSVANDPDVMKYTKKIKKFKVNKVTYSISRADPSTVKLTDGKITTGSGKTIASAASIDLSNTDETNLTIDNNGASELCKSLLESKQEKITLQGTLSSTPVSFTVKLKFYLTVTANVLD